ncbi:carboxylesterase, partial [Musa troglodytarum]
MEESGKKHFVLVHGICQGAWCWYKLVTLLRSAGHRVTAVDLGAAGVDPQRLDELRSMDDYARPLFHAIASLPPHQKPVLVGHSFGGASVSLAMEKFPDKISVAVFVTAVMPSTTVAMAALADEFFEAHPPEAYLDSKVTISADPQNPSSRMRLDAGDAAGEARELVFGRSATRWDSHGGEVRVGEKGVHRVQGGLGHDRGLPALDDPSQPGGASGGDRRCRSYGDALQAGGSVQTPPRYRRKILMTKAH